jgi:glycosyltransferase involved in cell wall biosynthesis
MSSPARELVVHCPFDPARIAAHLGEADYSYAFVLERFLPLLESLGPVTRCHETGAIAAACDRARAAGRRPVLLAFAPPHRLPAAVPCPTVPVFAWEFDTIPDESWDGDDRQNWAAVLARLPGGITHSRFAVEAVRRSLGGNYPVCSLPAPVWDASAALTEAAWTGRSRTLRFTGAVLDSAALGLDRETSFEPVAFAEAEREVTLSGLVFTTIANPDDARKNWLDQLTAFAWTFRDDPATTLVFKLVHHDRDRDRVCQEVLLELRRLAPFRCRIVAIHGYLEAPVFAELIRASTYVVNASRGEGQCLPLMEFMSAGTPAVAPDHTALADYVHPDNAFLVRTSPEWTHWPHDPRRRLRCLSHRLDWDSLCEALAAAARTARENPGRYAAMGDSARRTLEQHCSIAVVGAGLSEFLQAIEPLGREAA